MLDRRPPFDPEADDAAVETGVGAVLARWLSDDPCAQAVAELSAIDPGSLSDDDRVRLLIGLDRQSAWLAALQLPGLVAGGDAYADTVAEARQVATARLAALEATDPEAAERANSGRTVASTVASIFGS